MNKQKGRHRFTPEEVAQFQFLFEFHDSDEDGLLASSLLGRLLQLTGITLLEKELENKVNQLDLKGGSFDLNDLLEILDSKMRD